MPAFAEEIEIRARVVEIPEYTIRAMAVALARLNPIAPLFLVLIPIILGEFLIRQFDAIRLNEPVKVLLRMLIIIVALALLAAAI